MEFVEPSVTAIGTEKDKDPSAIMEVIERGYRICYKSEHLMREGSSAFVRKLLHEGEKSRNIHSSPLEHRRITVAVEDWLVEAVEAWQGDRGTAFITAYPQKAPSAEEHPWALEGNLRAFFDFVKGYGAAEDDIDGDWFRLDEARLVINSELYKFFPDIFMRLIPWDDTDNAIDWEACTYIGEAEDYVTFHVVTTRDILQEVARNRTISPNAESTRYCNYNKKGITFCYPRPYEWSDALNDLHDSYSCVADCGTMEELFKLVTSVAEEAYNKALEIGAKPQEARMLLPGALKTEMLLTGTYADWAHFLKLRNDPDAHPQMVYIANAIETWFIDNGIKDIRAYDRY